MILLKIHLCCKCDRVYIVDATGNRYNLFVFSRNLIYTGLARAKQLAIIVVSGKAIRQDQVEKRSTHLPERLKGVIT
jgi:ATP-dependent exoDNAse (exonuclease V) alpha subunit